MLLLELKEQADEFRYEEHPNPHYKENFIGLPSSNPRTIRSYVPNWNGYISMWVHVMDDSGHTRWERANRGLLQELEKDPRNESFVLNHLREYVQNAENGKENN